MSFAAINELTRRLAQVVRVGKVKEVDLEKCRVKVTIGKNESAWIPWVTERAGDVTIWNPPAKDEQVVVIAPGGESNLAFVLPGSIYKQSKPSKDKREKTIRWDFPDDGNFELRLGNITQTVKNDEVKIKATGTTNAELTLKKSEILAKVKDSMAYITQFGTLLDNQFGQINLTNQKAEVKFANTRATVQDGLVQVVCGGVSMSFNSAGNFVQIAVGGTQLNIQSGHIQIIGADVDGQQDVKAGTVSLAHHVHGGIEHGQGTTDPPT